LITRIMFVEDYKSEAPCRAISLSLLLLSPSEVQLPSPSLYARAPSICFFCQFETPCFKTIQTTAKFVICLFQLLRMGGTIPPPSHM
jgi:hypothetical protein